MRDFIVKHKTIIGFLCGCIAFIAVGKYHMHYQNQKECPNTQYEIINDVLYCDYLGRLVKPTDYKRLIK